MNTLLQRIRTALHSRCGFTMVEMSIVMSITGLLSAIAVPELISQEPSRKLNRMVWQLNAEMRSARTRAMSEGCALKVNYSRDTREFTFWVDSNGNSQRDSGEVETCPMEAGRGFSVNTYPYSFSAEFLPNGTFQVQNQTYSLTLITLSGSGAKHDYYLYVWPSGQVTVFKYAKYYNT